MKKLKIAQIAPLWFPVPPVKYGGTERVIYYLTEGLIKQNHKITLFASKDSKTKAKLISVVKKGLISQGVSWQDWWWNNLNYSLAFEMSKNFDIIHSHWTPLGMFFQRLVKIPVLHTFHNIPPKKDLRWEVLKYFRDSNVVFISKKQKENSPVRFKKEYVVYNGVDISFFKFNKKPKNYFLWVGRICPAKGTKEAVLIAKKAKIELILAGQVQPMYKDYFNKQIKPHLSKKIKYVGELSSKKLMLYYKNAKGFIFPPQWEEPFGLCLIEAMACGTPVIAFPRGSISEIVKDKETGFIVKNIEEAVEAVKIISKIKREDCRNWVEKNFTTEIMVKNYEKIYYQLL